MKLVSFPTAISFPLSFSKEMKSVSERNNGTPMPTLAAVLVIITMIWNQP